MSKGEAPPAAHRSPAPRRLPERIHFPAELPIAERRQDIASAIANHQVVIVAGETGSGKTTQLPKICLELGRGLEARIGHTQPRRLAARNVAQRIADELHSPLGELVGYQVRFTDSVSEQTAIKLMTDGILLNELQRDKDLRQYDTLIIDEAHERSLNIDFILGYLSRLLPRRPDLKVIVTSATIDVERFSSHFADAPIIEVSGRTYPVEVHYLGGDDEQEEGDSEQIARLLDDIEQEVFGPRGDVLVFLPGEREIRELSRKLRGSDQRQVLPLYARLSAAEQNRVFNPSGSGLRIILATNVAETSLTVPGIRYVIDSGTARISRYNYRSRLQRLPIEKISQASANQRKGRCGRIAAGVCFRLYSESDFLARPEFTDPEILRTNLAAVILRMLELRLGKVSAFPFIDKPEASMVREGYKLLEELGAVSSKGGLTSLGRKMARLPIDPKLARIILEAANNNALTETLVIVSALSVQDPRERPSEKQTQSDQAHARFHHESSDFLSWINLWRYVEEQRQALSQNQFRKRCKQEFLSYLRLREWRDIHGQLVVASRQLGFTVRPSLPDEHHYEGIHRALLAGFLGQIAQQDEGRIFNAARNRKLQIFPGSRLFKKPPKWLVAAEIVETTQVFARQCGTIDPAWLLKTNPYLLKRHYYEPAWQQRSGRVMAKERVSLFGLVISDGRRVHYGDVAPGESRQLFIREGLITGDYKAPPDFLKANMAQIRTVQDLESRARRQDLLVDEEALFAFYDERIPAHCVSAGTLEKWLRAEPDADKHLRLSRAHILTRDPGSELLEQFPSQLFLGDTVYRLTYRFEPGRDRDGVSVTVPLALLNRAPRYRFEWLVPGLLREKCIAMVKSLPKQLRKQLVPVPDVVDEVLAEMTPEDVPLTEALGSALALSRRVRVSPADWAVETLDDYYSMNIRVVDDRGRLLAESRNMAELIERFRQDGSSAAVSSSSDFPARDSIERWDFEALPEEWQSKAAGMKVISFPALVDHGERIGVQLLDYHAEAKLAHRDGIAALAMKRSAQTMKSLRKQLLSSNDAALALAGCGLSRHELVTEMSKVALLSLYEGDLPRSAEEFDALLKASKGRWVPKAQDLERILLNALQSFAAAKTHLQRYDASAYADSRADIDRQIAALVAPGKLSVAPWMWVEQYPRYAKGIVYRVERLSGQYAKDQKNMGFLGPATERLEQQLLGYPGLLVLSDAASQYRWMLEEFRISLFAQQLGTKMPVSIKRLDEQWSRVQSWVGANPR